jgi:hypothetical protein
MRRPKPISSRSSPWSFDARVSKSSVPTIIQDRRRREFCCSLLPLLGQAIVERRVVGLDRSLQRVVLMTNRRHGEPVEMQIGRHRRHRAALARVGLFLRRADRRTCPCARVRCAKARDGSSPHVAIAITEIFYSEREYVVRHQCGEPTRALLR